MLGCALSSEVLASDVEVDLGADLKSFFVGSFPYDHPIMPDEDSASGIIDFRGKLNVDAGNAFRLDVHHAMTGTAAPSSVSALGMGTGVGLTAPEAIRLGWTGVDNSGMQVVGRTDRLVMKSSLGPTRIALGRQSITLGTGQIFTPLDLVNPLAPTWTPDSIKNRSSVVQMTPKALKTTLHGGPWRGPGPDHFSKSVAEQSRAPFRSLWY